MAKLFKLELMLLLRSPAFWVLAVIFNALLNFLIFSKQMHTSWEAARIVSSDFLPLMTFLILLYTTSLPRREQNAGMTDIIASLPHPASRLFWLRFSSGLSLLLLLSAQLYAVIALRQGAMGLAPLVWSEYLRHWLVMAVPSIAAAYSLGFALGHSTKFVWLPIPLAAGIWLSAIALSGNGVNSTGYYLLGILSPVPLLIHHNISQLLGWSIEWHLFLGNRLLWLGTAGVPVMFTLWLQQRRRRENVLATAIISILCITVAGTGLAVYGQEVNRRVSAYQGELAQIEPDGDELPELPAVDIVEQSLDIQLLTAANLLRGESRIRFTWKESDDRLMLNLMGIFAVTDVKIDGNPRTWQQNGDFVDIDLGSFAAPGTEMTVDICWEGTVRQWRHGWADLSLDLVLFVAPQGVMLPPLFSWYPRLDTANISQARASQFLAGQPLLILNSSSPGKPVLYSLSVTTDSDLPLAVNMRPQTVSGRTITYEPAVLDGLAIFGGTYSDHNGNYAHADNASGLAALQAELDRIMALLLEIMPEPGTRPTLVQLPMDPRSISWQVSANLVQLSDQRLLHAAVGKTEELAPMVLPLWWQDRILQGSSFLETAMQSFLTDYVIFHDDPELYQRIKAERLVMLEAYGSDSMQEYHPDPRLIRFADPWSNLIWLALDAELNSGGKSELVSTIKWLLPLSREDLTFDKEQEVLDYAREKLGVER